MPRRDRRVPTREPAGRAPQPSSSGRPETLLGELEAAIMTHCWTMAHASGRLDGAPQTVADVQRALAAAGRTSAYTTIMTVMGRLVEKGLLERTASSGRTGPGSRHRYWPTQSEAEFVAAAAHTRVADLVATFGEMALAQFADALGTLDPERLEALRRLAQVDQSSQSDQTERTEQTGSDPETHRRRPRR